MSEPTPVSPNETPAAPKGKGLRFNLPLAFSIGAIILVALLWIDTRRQFTSVESDLAKKLAQSDTKLSEGKLLASQAQEGTREAMVKLGLLDQKLAESQSQQVALQAMYDELSSNRDEWAISEIEQVLQIANQQLQLAGNVKSALIALEAADARLQHYNKPQFYNLRKAINRDIERLKALPYVDVQGVSLRLDSMIEEVGSLPLLPGRQEKPENRKSGPTVAPHWWEQLLTEALGDFKQMVRVQNMGRQEMPLLPPDQAYFLRQNLELRLLSARIALLSRDERSYKADLKTAAKWIGQYYDPKDVNVKNMLLELQQLASSPVNIALPDISGSLNAVHTLQSTAERGSH